MRCLACCPSTDPWLSAPPSQVVWPSRLRKREKASSFERHTPSDQHEIPPRSRRLIATAQASYQTGRRCQVFFAEVLRAAELRCWAGANRVKNFHNLGLNAILGIKLGRWREIGCNPKCQILKPPPCFSKGTRKSFIQCQGLTLSRLIMLLLLREK